MSLMDGADTVVDELTEEQARSVFEKACQNELGMSAEEFLRRYDIDDLEGLDAAAVNRLEFLLPFAR